VRNNPLKYVDPSGHDVVYASGAGEDCRTEYKGSCFSNELVDLISLYKGWTSDQTTRWGQEWTKLALQGQKSGDWSMLNAFEKSAGVKIASYNGQGNTPVADVLKLQEQIDGFKDITLIGYSKGANLVANYIAYKTNHGFKTGPNVNKFVIAKAPTGFLQNSIANTSHPGWPFVTFGKTALIGSHGQVVNIYGFPDVAGDQGSLIGATLNIEDNNGVRCCGVSGSGFGSSANFGYHNPPSKAAMQQAFTALNVQSDYGSGFKP
jgi:hypothetical protein